MIIPLADFQFKIELTSPFDRKVPPYPLIRVQSQAWLLSSRGQKEMLASSFSPSLAFICNHVDESLTCWKDDPGPYLRKIRSLSLNQSVYPFFFSWLLIKHAWCFQSSFICDSPLSSPSYTLEEYPTEIFYCWSKWGNTAHSLRQSSYQCMTKACSTIDALMLILYYLRPSDLHVLPFHPFKRCYREL